MANHTPTAAARVPFSTPQHNPLRESWVAFLERNPEAMTPTAAAKLAAVLGIKAEVLLP